MGGLLLPVLVAMEAIELVSIELVPAFIRPGRIIIPLDMLAMARVAKVITLLLISILSCGKKSNEK